MNHEQLLQIGIKKRNGEITDSWNDLAIRYSDGFFQDGETFRCWVKNRLRSQQSVQNSNSDDVSNVNFKESIEINKDGSQSSNKLVKMSLEQTKDATYLLKAHGYDPNEWELIGAKSNIWNAFSKQTGKIQMYASKISVKPRKDSVSLDEVKRFFTEMVNTYRQPTLNPSKYQLNGKMLEVNVTDLHLGKLGGMDANDKYNNEIAKERFFRIINSIIERTKGYTFEKILFVWSNDYFHVDNSTGTTTAGTRQDVTMRFNELFKIGVQMLVEAIDLLSQIAPVHTCYVGANHDKLMSYFATEYLAAWYRNNPNVTVDSDPKIRKYIEFGKVLLGLTHGHAEGKRVKNVMPIEVPEAWGRTVFREMHQGHIHSEKAEVVEENGIIVRHLASPSGNDTWHYESAYVGSIRKSQNFIWDKENGLEAILNVSF